MTIDIQKIRAHLEQKRTELQAHIEDQIKEQHLSLKELSPDDEPHNFADLSSDEALVALGRTALSDEASQLLAVKNALVRIDKGTYGICRACGQPIAEKRLEALPWVELCVKDQAQREHSRYMVT